MHDSLGRGAYFRFAWCSRAAQGPINFAEHEIGMGVFDMPIKRGRFQAQRDWYRYCRDLNTA